VERNVEALFELVQSALTKTKYTEPVSRETYAHAMENGLSGMFYPILDKELIEPKVYARLQSDYYEYLKRDTLQLNAIEDVHQLFKDNGIEHVFLKGSFLKYKYPETYMRSMGDIDILVHPESMEWVHKILPENGFSNWLNSAAHDCFQKGEDLFLEIHPKLDSEIDDLYSPMLEGTWEHVVTNNGSSEFEPQFQLAYLLYHMIKHLSTSGIGIRNILDIGLYIQSIQSENQATPLLEVLEGYHLKKFFQNVLYLSKMYFGLQINDSYFDSFQMDSEFYEEITRFIVVSGVHGSGKEHNPYLSGMSKSALKEQNLESGKKKYLLKTFFPPYRTMKGMYHYLDKCPIFLPIAWLQRAFRLMFKKTKSTVQKIKMLKIDDESVKKVEDLYQKLGL